MNPSPERQSNQLGSLTRIAAPKRYPRLIVLAALSGPPRAPAIATRGLTTSRPTQAFMRVRAKKFLASISAVFRHALGSAFGRDLGYDDDRPRVVVLVAAEV